MAGFSNEAHTCVECFYLYLSVNSFHVVDDIPVKTPDDFDIHRQAKSVLLSALHPLTTHPERWERRFK